MCLCDVHVCALAIRSIKTLEFWIDNLSPEFLGPILGHPSVHTPLMSTLCALMKPPPAKHGVDALRLLGKLGGRNRLFLMEPPTLLFDTINGNGTALGVTWNEGTGSIEVAHPSSVPPVPEEACGDDAARRLKTFLEHRQQQAAGRAASAVPDVMIDVPLTAPLPVDNIISTCLEVLSRHHCNASSGGQSSSAITLALLAVNTPAIGQNDPAASLAINQAGGDLSLDTAVSLPPVFASSSDEVRMCWGLCVCVCFGGYV